MNILFIGDIVGKVGRKALKENLSFLISKYKVDFVIVNGENISGGRGISFYDYNFLTNLGVNAITLGNHYIDKKEELKLFIDNDNIIRPYNILDESFLGKGSRMYLVNGIKVRVTNILGSVFMKEEVKPPYLAMSELLIDDDSNIHIVDFHGEATGEKSSFMYAFKDEISGVIGTHTHVQTRDAKIVDNKIAYISDVGMCGARNGILGYEATSVVERQLKGLNKPMRLLDDAPYVLNGVVITFDDLFYNPVKIVALNIEGEFKRNEEN